MLINFTNHPSSKWSEKQINLAKEQYGSILDYQFPQIPPEANEAEIQQLAEHYFSLIAAAFDSCANTPHQHAVHIQGEFTFVFTLINMLISSKIKCIASTTQRIVEEKNGKKIVLFDFIRFREYKLY